jgi:hypothetical protein
MRLYAQQRPVADRLLVMSCRGLIEVSQAAARSQNWKKNDCTNAACEPPAGGNMDDWGSARLLATVTADGNGDGISVLGVGGRRGVMLPTRRLAPPPRCQAPSSPCALTLGIICTVRLGGRRGWSFSHMHTAHKHMRARRPPQLRQRAAPRVPKWKKSATRAQSAYPYGWWRPGSRGSLHPS